MKRALSLLLLCLPQLAHAQQAPDPTRWLPTFMAHDTHMTRRDAARGRCEEAAHDAAGAPLWQRALVYDARGWLASWEETRGGWQPQIVEYTRDRRGRVTRRVEVRGDHRQRAVTTYKWGRHATRPRSIAHTDEAPGLDGRRDVRRDEVHFLPRAGGWVMKVATWLPQRSVSTHTLEVEGEARPRSAYRVEERERVRYSYDARGRLTELRSDVGDRRVYAASYDGAGRLSAERYPGWEVAWRYDDAGRPARLEVLEQGSGLRGALVVSWDGGAARRIVCQPVAEASPGEGDSAALWAVLREGDACGVAHADWIAWSAGCVASVREGAHKK